MKSPEPQSGSSGAHDTSHYAVSEFTQELLDAVAEDHYRLRAWSTFLSRAWARSLEDIRQSRARTLSFSLWAAVIAAIGAGIILLTLRYQQAEQSLDAILWWLLWYASTVIFVLTHLGMADDDGGMPHNSLLLPNALSFCRLALAPLVLWPCLKIPINPTTGPVFALFLAGLSVTDLLDGWIARFRKTATRLGRMLDVLADLAFVTFLAVGLYLAGAIPGPLLLLLVARFPVLFIGVLVMYFVVGPAPLPPTKIGRATTFATNVVLLVIAFNLLLPISLPPSSWIEWSVRLLYWLIAANIVYLLYRAVDWRGLKRGEN